MIREFSRSKCKLNDLPWKMRCRKVVEEGKLGEESCELRSKYYLGKGAAAAN